MFEVNSDMDIWIFPLRLFLLVCNSHNWIHDNKWHKTCTRRAQSHHCYFLYEQFYVIFPNPSVFTSQHLSLWAIVPTLHFPVCNVMTFFCVPVCKHVRYLFLLILTKHLSLFREIKKIKNTV